MGPQVHKESDTTMFVVTLLDLFLWQQVEILTIRMMWFGG